MKAIALSAVILFAGCIGPEADDPPQATLDLITPGNWHVSGEDMILAYHHNPTDEAIPITWELTMEDGSAIPESWGLTFEPATSTAQPAGTKVQGVYGMEYPDWQTTLIRVNNVPLGGHALMLHAGGAHKSVWMESTEARATSAPDNTVSVDYRGTFTETGAQFDAGQFSTTLGQTPRETVPGFDGGLMGLHLGESATLVLPAALAYGYDQENNPSRAQFDEKGLTFEVTLNSISA